MRFPEVTRDRPLLALVTVAFLSACWGCGGGDDSVTGAGGSSSASSSSGDAGGPDGGAVNRGPAAVPFDDSADPNGLWWDEATDTLYIADDGNNRILSWTDSAGITLVSGLPAAPQNGPGLGQVVKTADGTLIVTRFGFGTAGDVVYVKADKTMGKVPNLDVTKRRIGLTVAADGTLYDGYFVKTTTSQIGAVARLDLTGSEMDVVTSLSKPVGVLASGTNLVISDQATNTVVETPLAKPGTVTTLVPMITGPDLLCAGPSGTYYMGGTTGDIRQITSTGQYSTFEGGFLQIRGVAYDAKNKRLFAAEHDPNGVMNALRILPVN
jgi:hypothetical protein